MSSNPRPSGRRPLSMASAWMVSPRFFLRISFFLLLSWFCLFPRLFFPGRLGFARAVLSRILELRRPRPPPPPCFPLQSCLLVHPFRKPRDRVYFPARFSDR